MLVIIRGVSGSGKSSICSELVSRHPGWTHLDADIFNRDNRHIFSEESDEDIARERYIRAKSARALELLSEHPVVLMDGVYMRRSDIEVALEPVDSVDVVVVELRVSPEGARARILGDDHLLGPSEKRGHAMQIGLAGWERSERVHSIVDTDGCSVQEIADRIELITSR